MRKHRGFTRSLLAMAAGSFLALAGATVAMAAPPTNTTAPSITGTPKVGETLTAQNGTWTNSPTAFQYQWQRCGGAGAGCTSISAAVQKTYLLTSADANRTLRVQVLAVNADGSNTARSGPTGVVAPSTAPQNTARPTITGDTRVGEALTAEDGTWTNSPTSFAYEWERCDIDGTGCAAIAGATGKTYGVRTIDLGFRLRVTVTARNSGGSGAATSALSGIVAPTVVVTNKRPTLTIVSVRFFGARVYARFRICDDANKNLTILETDSRPGRASHTRRFSTTIAPNPCGVYTRNWVPVQRFRGKGRFTVTLQARDTSGLTSAPARRTFAR
jgi:hypothetical protein